MLEPSPEIIIERIRSALGTQRIQDAVRILLELRPVDQAEVFNLLTDEEQILLLTELDIPSTADLFEELENEEVLDAVGTLSPERLADVLDEMEPDEAADLLGDLSPARATEALANMEDAEDVIPLLGYPDESAGGLMTTSYIALRRHTTARQAIEFLRQVSLDVEVPYYLYAIDREKHLIGVVGFRQLVIADPGVTVEQIMDREVIYVTVGDDQEDVARVMSRYNLAALPVVDDQHRLLGVITHDDIIDVLEEEATEDIYHLANVTDKDLNPQSPIVDQVKGRLPWLYLNMVTALFASWVISRFENVIAEVAILAAFQSVIAGLGGNSGSQNVAMIVRAIALDKIDSREMLGVIFKQVIVGMLQGIGVGVVIGIGVAFWQNDLYLGAIVTMAMIANMIIAGIMGTIVPFIVKALGQDPALASTVLVTAATDSFGFFIFLGLASLLLPYLVNSP